MRIFSAVLVTLALIAVGRSAAADPRLTVDFETGPAYILQNHGRYGADGTPYDAADVGQQKNLLLSQRTSLELGLGRHTLILLYAPFEAVTRVRLDDDLSFRDVTFPQGTVVDHRYLFDGYRLSYLYGLKWPCLRLDLGASFQVRNADVAFTSVNGVLHAAEDDIGLVFALKTRVAWVPPQGAWASLEADGFSTFGAFGVNGALYDVALTLGVPLADPLDLILRLRLLGGGAEVPKRDFENWANFFAATAGFRLEIDRLFGAGQAP